MQATIHNEFLTLTVDTHGAEAVSLKNAAGQLARPGEKDGGVALPV